MRFIQASPRAQGRAEKVRGQLWKGSQLQKNQPTTQCSCQIVPTNPSRLELDKSTINLKADARMIIPQVERETDRPPSPPLPFFRAVVVLCIDLDLARSTWL